MMKKLLLTLISTSILFACSKGKDKDPEPTISIDAQTIELKYDKDHQFALKKGNEDIFASTFTWVSSNEKVGKVDANGKFTARKIGEATVSGTGANGVKVESKVTISPYITIFTEPILEFGATMATIKSKEKRKLLKETTDGLAYEGAAGTQMRGVIYIFDKGKLQSAGILFDNTTATVQASATFIKERYPDRMTQDNQVYILNDERTFGIVLGVNETFGYMGIYLPYPLDGRLSAERAAYSAATTVAFKQLFK
ncbi:Ig-like domain-containing protein [Dyadobacter fermentans]|uniref:Ig-like domain-containing protein n=1 Tax=Dyadobacter fermentans TaxID=94254 RepID=UPI001CBBBF92|nr:Ig-like domain-containing protein [Dyadobacter fermentans]MBZ1363029.1 Ig-like domain-containing protein [Dyadobacter fermentans]